MAKDLIAQGLALGAVRVTVNQGHEFGSVLERDSYFADNPQELKEGIYIFCGSQLQRYENGAWNDRAVLIFTNADIINANNVIIDKSNFTSVLKKYTGDNTQTLFDYLDKSQEFPSGLIYIGEKDTPDSWKIEKVGQGLVFSRYQNSAYASIYTVENSSTTDNYFINAPEGRLAYITDDKAIHTLIKSSTDLKGCQINNVDGRISLMHNGTVASYHPSGERIKVDLNNITDAELTSKFIISYEQEVKISDNVLLFGVNEYYAIQPDAGMTVRVYITDKATGNLLAQSCSLGQFYSGNGNPVVDGANKVDFSEALPILEGKDIVLRADFADATEIQGAFKKIGAGTEERFYIKFNTYTQHLDEENMATQEWVDTNVAVSQDARDYLSKVSHEKTADSYTFTFGEDKLSKVKFNQKTTELIETSKDGLHTSNITIGENYANMSSDDGFIEVSNSSAIISCKDVNISAETSLRLYHRDTDYAIDLDKDGVGLNMGDSNLIVKADGTVTVKGKVSINDHAIVQDGTGTKFLADNGTYVESSGGWDMKVDLTESENITVIKKGGTPTVYTHFHDIPFLRQNEYIPDAYIEIETQPRTNIDISSAMYFTIKGDEPYTANYTDNSVKFRLKVVKRDGSIVYTDCVSCTGNVPAIYNELKAPIDTESTVGLWCNSLRDPYGFVPNDRFTVSFYVGSGEVDKQVPLFDISTGLVNEAILPTSNDINNRFNEILLYNEKADDDSLVYPRFTYDAEAFGEIPCITLTSGHGTAIAHGNLVSEMFFITNAKDGVATVYLEDQDNIEIAGKESDTVMDGTSWQIKFPKPTNVISNGILGFAMITDIGTKINVKLMKMDGEQTIFDKTISFDKVTENKSPSYCLLSDGTNDLYYMYSGDYVLTVTLVSGGVYGVDFPYFSMMLGDVTRDSLINKSTIESQVFLKTNPDTFTVENNKITALKEKNDLTCTNITIPKAVSNGSMITSVADNIFPYTSGVDITINAELGAIGENNFISSDGLTQNKLYISPNNVGTWDAIKTIGALITPIELPVVPKESYDTSLIINADDRMVWAKNPVRDGCVYLTANNRIRAIDGSGFIFEVLVGTEWKAVTRFDL